MPRFKKGSEAAKRYMAKIRKKRKIHKRHAVHKKRILHKRHRVHRRHKEHHHKKRHGFFKIFRRRKRATHRKHTKSKFPLAVAGALLFDVGLIGGSLFGTPAASTTPTPPPTYTPNPNANIAAYNTWWNSNLQSYIPVSLQQNATAAQQQALGTFLNNIQTQLGSGSLTIAAAEAQTITYWQTLAAQIPTTTTTQQVSPPQTPTPPPTPQPQPNIPAAPSGTSFASPVATGQGTQSSPYIVASGWKGSGYYYFSGSKLETNTIITSVSQLANLNQIIYGTSLYANSLYNQYAPTPSVYPNPPPSNSSGTLGSLYPNVSVNTGYIYPAGIVFLSGDGTKFTSGTPNSAQASNWLGAGWIFVNGIGFFNIGVGGTVVSTP